MSSRWYIPVSEGGQTKGISDSGIDLFKADPVKSLTREMCQNSIDVRVDSSSPVRMEFDLFEIDGTEIPGRDDLINIYEEAEEFAKTQKHFHKAEKYFKRTLPLLKSDKIPVLRISDFNTRGLDGADDPRDWSSGWFRLVRSVSSSDKDEGSIGKYGSGKLSAFVCSNFQTVFYSTKAIKNDVVAYEGVTKLMNYIDRDDNTRTDVGYYCEGSSEPIFRQADFQKTFSRTEYGTDIYIFGFKYAKNNWQEDIIVSLLDGFLYALMEKHLSVKIGDIPVDHTTVDGLIKQYQDQLDSHTLDYYKLLTYTEEDGVATRELSYLEDKDIIVKMMVKPDLHKRVGIIRHPGMKVFDKGHISSTVSFAGICIIKGKQISQLFGGLENIQHTQWELNRYDDDPELKAKASKYRTKLYRELSALFNELKGETATDDLDPDIGDCLPDPFSDEKKEQETISDAVLEIGKTREVNVSPGNDISATDPEGEDDIEDDGSNGRSGGSHDPHPPYPGPDPEPGPGPDPGEEPAKRKLKRVKANVRSKAVDVANGSYILLITPTEDVVNGVIDVRMGAESDSYKAEIISASIDGKPLKVSQNCVNNIYLTKGKKGKLEVNLNYSDLCSLEVHVYGY
jgi:hypothetical protein